MLRDPFSFANFNFADNPIVQAFYNGNKSFFFGSARVKSITLFVPFKINLPRVRKLTYNGVGSDLLRSGGSSRGSMSQEIAEGQRRGDDLPFLLEI